MRIKWRSGFTLIELLIVIAIIAILAAIAIPQFAKYRVRAFNQAALSDLRRVVMTEELYASDNGSFLYLRTRGYWAPTGTVTLWDKHNRRADKINLSKGVYLYIRTDRGVYSTYTAVTKHKAGNAYFGAEPDASGYFYDKKTTYIGKRLRNRDCPRPHPDRIDFVPGAAGHNWTRF